MFTLNELCNLICFRVITSHDTTIEGFLKHSMQKRKQSFGTSFVFQQMSPHVHFPLAFCRFCHFYHWMRLNYATENEIIRNSFSLKIKLSPEIEMFGIKWTFTIHCSLIPINKFQYPFDCVSWYVYVIVCVFVYAYVCIVCLFMAFFDSSKCCCCCVSVFHGSCFFFFSSSSLIRFAFVLCVRMYVVANVCVEHEHTVFFSYIHLCVWIPYVNVCIFECILPYQSASYNHFVLSVKHLHTVERENSCRLCFFSSFLLHLLFSSLTLLFLKTNHSKDSSIPKSE